MTGTGWHRQASLQAWGWSVNHSPPNSRWSLGGATQHFRTDKILDRYNEVIYFILRRLKVMVRRLPIRARAKAGGAGIMYVWSTSTVVGILLVMSGLPKRALNRYRRQSIAGDNHFHRGYQCVGGGGPGHNRRFAAGAVPGRHEFNGLDLIGH